MENNGLKSPDKSNQEIIKNVTEAIAKVYHLDEINSKIAAILVRLVQEGKSNEAETRAFGYSKNIHWFKYNKSKIPDLLKSINEYVEIENIDTSAKTPNISANPITAGPNPESIIDPNKSEKLRDFRTQEESLAKELDDKILDLENVRNSINDTNRDKLQKQIDILTDEITGIIDQGGQIQKEIKVLEKELGLIVKSVSTPKPKAPKIISKPAPSVVKLKDEDTGAVIIDDKLKIAAAPKPGPKKITSFSDLGKVIGKDMADKKSPFNNREEPTQEQLDRYAKRLEVERLHEEKLLEIENKKEEARAKRKRDDLEFETNLKKPSPDPEKKDKDQISLIAKKEIEKGKSALSSKERDIKKRYPEEFDLALETLLDKKIDPTTMCQEIAEAESAGEVLTGTQQKFLLDNPRLKIKIGTIKAQITKDKKRLERIAEQIAHGEKINPADKDFYRKNKDKIAEKSSDFQDEASEQKSELIDKISGMIASGAVITTSEDLSAFKKYKTEILEAAEKILEKNKVDGAMVDSIVYAEINNIPLTEKQLLYSRIPGERAKIDTQLAELKVYRAKLVFFANEIVNGTIFTDPLDKKFYEDHKADIESEIPAIKEANLKLAKENLITQIVTGNALTPAEEKLEQEHKAELDPLIIKKLKEALVTAENNGDIDERNRLRELIESRIRLSHKSKEAYEPLIKRFKEVSARIEKLEAEIDAKKDHAHGHTDSHGHAHNDGHGHDSHAPAGHDNHGSDVDEHLLHALKKERDDIYASLDKLGPSGRDLAHLETARESLAKASQEFQKSFVRKFPGAKILGVMAGMFGSKWSAVKESDKTAHAQEKMRKAQSSYNDVREKLMNVFIGEEYAVREAWGQDLKNLSNTDRESMKDFLNGISKQFIDDEYKKLDKAKNVLEGTVRGSAMRRFGEWYSKGGFYKNVKNPVLRKVLNRVTSGAILSAGIFLVPGVGAGAAFGSYVGYRAGRAAISGTVGESMALGVATAYGGKLNDKGEFEKLAAVRDAELKESRKNFTKLMMERLGKEEKPLMTASLMQKLNEDHARAVGNYMNSQGNVRRAEMWTRLLTGGAMAYGLTHLIPNPVPTYIPGPQPAPISGPIPGPGSGDLTLEGVSTPASSLGSAHTFSTLKNLMIDKYANEPGFQGLSREAIAEKMINQGNMDSFTEEIMGAKTAQDFLAVAGRHGFWKVDGAGNPAVDSASVPAGSTIGFATGNDGDLHYFIKTPNGERIEMNDFSKIADTQRGVGLIDTDGSRSVRAMGPGNMGVPGAAGESNYIIDDNTAPDGSLDAAEYGYGQASTSSSVDGSPEFSSDNDAPEIVNNNVGGAVASGTIENGDYIKDLYIHNPSINSPVGLYDYLFKNTDATIHVKPDTETISKYAGREVPDFRRPENFQQRADYRNMLASGHASSITIDGKEYMLPKHENSLNPSLNKFDIAYKGNIVRYGQIEDYLKIQGDKNYGALRAKLDNVYDNQPGQIDNTKIATFDVEEANKQANSLIDGSFEKHNIFGKKTPGVSTRAWAHMKDDTIGDHLKARNSGGLRYSGSGKEKAFMSNLDKEAKTYGVVLDPNETVESATKRVAEAAAISVKAANKAAANVPKK